ncbi:pentapeptide repeat-containing protein [Thermodesulfobacteriota bacterium]
MKEQIKEHAQKAAEFLTNKVPECLTDTSSFFTIRDKNNKRAANAICTVLAALFVLLCFLILPFDSETVSVTVGPDSKQMTKTTTTTSQGMLDVFALYLKIVGGTAVLGAAYFGWKRLEVNQEGQITERFTRAIDQLGSEKLEVRLGAIYALERIAKDSVKDHWPIMEVLTAYSREHARLLNSNDPSAEVEKNVPTLDIQAILTVLGRSEPPTTDGSMRTLDLGCINLTMVNLEEANLIGADLHKAVLSGANLCGTNLSQANLISTDLTDAWMDNADFSSAIMRGAQMSDVQASKANFQQAQLIYANIGDACLDDANMKQAILHRANFKDSSMFEINLEEAKMRNTCLQGAYLEGANLKGAYLPKANFEGAILSGANLGGANLGNGEALTIEQIESAIIDNETKLPSYLMDDPEWYEAQIKRSEEWLAVKYQESLVSQDSVLMSAIEDNEPSTL